MLKIAHALASCLDKTLHVCLIQLIAHDVLMMERSDDSAALCVHLMEQRVEVGQQPIARLHYLT